MTKQPYTASGLPKRILKVASSELPLSDVAGHDEWLLDEALTETCPASDSIVVRHIHPFRTSLLAGQEGDRQNFRLHHRPRQRP